MCSYQAQLLEEISKAFHEALGEDLIAIVVFGSYARGQARENSDVDILIVAQNLPERWWPRIRFLRKCVAGKIKRHLSIIAKTPAEFENSFPSYYLDLGLDGIVIFDKNHYMKTKLKKIRELLKIAGLRRVRRKGGFLWLWDKVPKGHWKLDWEGVDGIGT